MKSISMFYKNDQSNGFGITYTNHHIIDIISDTYENNFQDVSVDECIELLEYMMKQNYKPNDIFDKTDAIVMCAITHLNKMKHPLTLTDFTGVIYEL